MIKFAKIIIDKKNNEYRNLHFLPELMQLMSKYDRYMFDDYFAGGDLADSLIELIEASGRFFWAVVDSDSEEMMGFAYFDNFIGNRERLHSAEINTCFKRKCWGKPTQEAGKLFIKYCFKKYGFEKIKASVFKENSMVKGLLKVLGFKREALLRGETFKNNKLQDVEIYSIRRSKKCRQKK